MTFDPDKHHRRSVRLRGHDYSSSGLYFITICTYQRQCLFGEIVNGEMRLNALGEIVETEWLKTSEIRPKWRLEAWIIMPNHIHGIVTIEQQQKSIKHGTIARVHGVAPLRDATQLKGIAHRKPDSISSFVAGFKSVTTKQINISRNTPRTPVWQRNYYDHIIRNNFSLRQIEQYIQNNPTTWQSDQLYPAQGTA
ncbi:transposase [Leptolyngbya sp. PCC 7375]|nr:transposase [Leptolyngbya sp. PCC 7375]